MRLFCTACVGIMIAILGLSTGATKVSMAAGSKVQRLAATQTCTYKYVDGTVNGKTVRVKVKTCKSVAAYKLHGSISASVCGGGYEIENADVVIRNENNKVIGNATTSADVNNSANSTDYGVQCKVTFTVKLPRAKIYQTKFGTHEGPTYSFAAMVKANWHVALFLN
jgi:hypothetical protein